MMGCSCSGSSASQFNRVFGRQIGPWTTQEDANFATGYANTFVPPQIAQLLNMNLAISNWSASNPGPLDQPEFHNAMATFTGMPPMGMWA